MAEIPMVKSVMTPFPYSIETGSPIGRARSMMQKHEIHHLPVKEGNELVGVVTARDIRRALDPSIVAPPKVQILVKDVMDPDPYIVDLNQPLDRVLFNLAESPVDCALVVKDARLAGIFTTRDACRVFGQFLRRLNASGDDAA